MTTSLIEFSVGLLAMLGVIIIASHVGVWAMKILVMIDHAWYELKERRKLHTNSLQQEIRENKMLDRGHTIATTIIVLFFIGCWIYFAIVYRETGIL